MRRRLTVKGQVTLPKAVRDAAGIKPGDKVDVRNVPGVGVVIERLRDETEIETFRRQWEEVARRRPMRDGPLAGMTSDEIMRLLRGEE